MKWKPYPAYKDSGVEWFGKLPNEWNVTKVRYISDCLDGRRVPLNAEQRADKQGDVPYWGANSIVDYVDEALFDEKLALLGEDGAPFFDRDKPVAFVSNGPVWPNNHVHILRIKPVEATSYVVYALNSVDYSGYIDGSTRDKLTQGQMNAIPLPWPDTELATKIATFLDRETAKLDTLISKQEHLIELLQEKRQAIISHAVTKGLDPDVPMKDSGIEWLGDVPVIWKLKPLFSVCRERNERNLGMREQNLLSLSFGRIVNKDIDSNEGLLPESFETYQVIYKGDIVFRLTDLQNDKRSLRTAIVRERGIITSAYIAVEPHDISPEYLNYLLRGYDTQKVFYSMGGGLRQSMKFSDLRRLPILVPNNKLQNEIVSYLDQETSKIDTLIERARQSIQLAKEHRTALISATVTGKIDVREAA